MKPLSYTLLALPLIATPTVYAEEVHYSPDYVTITAYVGERFSQDFTDSETGERAKLTNDIAQSLNIGWYYDTNKEGEVLISNSRHNISMDGTKQLSSKLNIVYAQFGGRVLFTNDSRFSQSIGLGLGAAFFVPDDSQYDNEITLSGSISGGLRYQFNDHWAAKADLRIHGSLFDSNSAIMCNYGDCLVKIDGRIYSQTELLAGLEYKF